MEDGQGSREGECVLHNACSASLRQHFLSTTSYCTYVIQLM